MEWLRKLSQSFTDTQYWGGEFSKKNPDYVPKFEIFQSPDFPHVFLGGEDDFEEVEARAGQPICKIVDCRDLPEIGASDWDYATYLTVQRQFNSKVQDLIQKISTTNCPIFVHCALGANRSVSVLAAALAKLTNKSLDQILSEMKQVRSFVGPEDPFYLMALDQSPSEDPQFKQQRFDELDQDFPLIQPGLPTNTAQSNWLVRVSGIEKTAMFVHGKGEHFVAYKSHVFLLDPHSQGVDDPIVRQMANFLGTDSKYIDTHDYLSNLRDTRPDILQGQIKDSLITLQTDNFQHGTGSSLLKHVMRALGVTNVEYQNSEEVYREHSDWQITGELPEYMFHGTTSQHAIRILRFGLQPGESTTNYPGRGPHGNISHDDVIFLAEDVDTAAHHATHTTQQGFPDIFPVIFRFKVPDQSLLVSDYDVEIMYDESFEGNIYNNTYKAPQDEFDASIKEEPFDFSKKVGVMGYRGRIPANFIVDIMIRPEGGEYYNYSGEEWISVTADQLQQALEFEDATMYAYEPEEDEYEEYAQDEEFDDTHASSNWLKKIASQELAQEYSRRWEEIRQKKNNMAMHLIKENPPDTYYEQIIQDAQVIQQALPMYESLLQWMSSQDSMIQDSQFNHQWQKTKLNLQENIKLSQEQIVSSQQPWNPSEYNVDEVIEWYADNGMDIRSVLQEFGIEYEEIQFTNNQVLVYSTPDDTFVYEKDGSITEAYQWVIDAEPLNYFDPNPDDHFWQDNLQGFVVYHATPQENVELIMREGLGAKNETRGIENRNTGDAVFVSDNPEDIDSYGDVVISIDVGAMQADGYMPNVAQEDPIEEKILKERLAHRIGLRDYNYEVESGISETTYVFYGSIPAKYLKLL